MTHDELESAINGGLLRLAREARGWTLNDMAIRSCMSVNQIRQVEEGGFSSFYSAAVKVTAAKRIGAILDVGPEQLFQLPQAVPEPMPASESMSDVTDVAQAAVPAVSVASPIDLEQTATNVSPHIDEVVATTSPEVEKSKTSMWAVGALFVTALAVAAWMRPEPDASVSEPVPVLQTIPTEADGAASTAAVSVSSEAVASLAAVANKPASAPASAAVATTGVKAASATAVVSPVVAPPAATASKTP